MIYTTRKKYAVLVVSLISLVISLPGITSAATVQPPAVKALAPITEEVRSPGKIALEADGSFFVVDARSEGVLYFNKYGHLERLIETPDSPQGVAIKDASTLIVSTVSYVSLYSKSGGEIAGSRLKATGGSSDEVFKKANGVAVDPTGNIYVADGADNCVKIYSPSGVRSGQIGTCGTRGTNTGIFWNPSAVAYERAANQIAVADAINGRIQFFDATNYAYVKTYGVVGVGDEPACYASPQSISFEYENNVLKRMYIADAYKSAVQAIDPASTTLQLTRYGVPTVPNVIRTGGFLGYIGCTAVPNGYGGTNYICGGDANGQLRLPSDAQFDPAYRRLIVSNGAGNITVYGIDGGVSPIDDTPPLCTLTTPPAVVNSSSLLIGGMIEAGATISVAVNTGASVTNLTNNGSTWSATLNGLAYGDNVITVTAKDVALNPTVVEATVSYKLPAPSVSIGSVASVTKNIDFPVSGTVDAGAGVNLTVNGGAPVAATVNGTSWSASVNLASEGANTIVANASYANSAIGTQSKVVVRDTIAPVLQVSAIGAGSTLAAPVPAGSQTINVSGKVTDLNLAYSPATPVVINGGSSGTQAVSCMSDGSFSATVTLNSGSNHIAIQAADAAGNLSALDSRYLSYATGSPVLSVTNPGDNAFVNTPTVVANGDVDSPATTSITVSGGGTPVPDGLGHWASSPITLASGVNTIVVTATNSVTGKTSTIKRTVTLDAGAPVVTITTPAAGSVSTNDPNPYVIRGTFSDDSAVTITATVNSNSNPVTVDYVKGTFETTVNFSGEGTYNVVITATDASGNQTAVPRTLILDRTNPTDLTIIATKIDGTPLPGANFPPRVEGTVEAGCSVVVKADTKDICTATVVGTTWSCVLGSGYAPAVVTAVATDAAQNSRTASLTPSVLDGDINIDSSLTMADVQVALEIAVGLLPAPTAQQLSHGDVAPVINGKVNSDGRITIDDAMLIKRKVLGLTSF